MNVQMALMKLGAGVEDVQESLVLTVDVREKMLRALRQAHNGLQIDDLRTGSLYRGILPRRHLQIAQFLGGVILLGFHAEHPLSIQYVTIIPLL